MLRMHAIILLLVYTEICFIDCKKDDPIEGMKLKELIDRLSNRKVDKTVKKELLVEALGKHFMRTLQYLKFNRWSVIKGRVVCASGEVPKIGTRGQLARKVPCEKFALTFKFIIADNDGSFYIGQDHPFPKCVEATYTLLLDTDADHCLPNGFAEWGPEDDLSTEKNKQVDLGDFKYTKMEDKLKLKGKLFCNKNKDKYKIPKGDVLELTKSPSMELCDKSQKEGIWEKKFEIEKAGSFKMDHMKMFLFCADVVYSIKVNSSKMCKDGSAEWHGKQSIEDMGDIILKTPAQADSTTKKPKSFFKKSRR